MIFMVVILGFGIVFGFGLEKNGRSNYLRRDNLIKLLLKIVILTVLLSPDAFQFFNKYVINFVVFPIFILVVSDLFFKLNAIPFNIKSVFTTVFSNFKVWFSCRIFS